MVWIFIFILMISGVYFRIYIDIYDAFGYRLFCWKLKTENNKNNNNKKVNVHFAVTIHIPWCTIHSAGPKKKKKKKKKAKHRHGKRKMLPKRTHSVLVMNWFIKSYVMKNLKYWFCILCYKYAAIDW